MCGCVRACRHTEVEALEDVVEERGCTAFVCVVAVNLHGPAAHAIQDKGTVAGWGGGGGGGGGECVPLSM